MNEDDKWLRDSLKYMCILQNWQAESFSYNWDDDYALRELRYSRDRFYNNDTIRDHFCLAKLTEERCRAIGFARWSDESDVLLFPLWYVPFIPDGQLVIDINGESHHYEKGKEDLDVRFGCVAFGIHASDLIKKVTVN